MSGVEVSPLDDYTKPNRFVDQLDADQLAIRFLESRPTVTNIEYHNHETSGRTGLAFCDYHLIATTVVIRDDMNYSVVVCHDLRNKNPA